MVQWLLNKQGSKAEWYLQHRPSKPRQSQSISCEVSSWSKPRKWYLHTLFCQYFCLFIMACTKSGYLMLQGSWTCHFGACNLALTQKPKTSHLQVPHHYPWREFYVLLSTQVVISVVLWSKSRKTSSFRCDSSLTCRCCSQLWEIRTTSPHHLDFHLVRWKK